VAVEVARTAGPHEVTEDAKDAVEQALAKAGPAELLRALAQELEVTEAKEDSSTVEMGLGQIWIDDAAIVRKAALDVEANHRLYSC
jgi:hypothetical protein